jgi:hypothetical protein
MNITPRVRPDITRVPEKEQGEIAADEIAVGNRDDLSPT